MSDELITRIDKLRTLIAGKPELRWGVVTGVVPLAIRLDGDTEPLAGTPATNVTGLAVGDRVSVLIQSRRATIMGRAQGADVSDTGWHNLILSTGWTAVAGHTPRARLLGGRVSIDGAAFRGVGGNPNNVATLPSAITLLGDKTTFVGSTVMTLQGTSTIAVAEFFLHFPTRRLRFDGYSNIGTGANWTVPLKADFPADMR